MTLYGTASYIIPTNNITVFFFLPLFLGYSNLHLSKKLFKQSCTEVSSRGFNITNFDACISGRTNNVPFFTRG